MSIETIINKGSSWILQLPLIVSANYLANILDYCIKLGQTKCDKILSRSINTK